MVGLFFSALTLLLLSQVTNGKTTSMKLSPPGGSGSALKDHRLSTTGKPTNQPGALLSADRQRLQNLMAPFQENTSTKGASKESSGSDGVVLPRAAASSSKDAIGDISSESGEESGGGEEDVIATNEIVFYSIDVGVGASANVHSILIDTGSSNTWIGAQTPYRQTSTSEDQNAQFGVTYGSGEVQGELFEDRITLGELVIEGQGIGVAQQAIGFGDTDGILGIGPTALTRGTVDGSNDTVPTVIDMLFEQGEIDEPMIGVFFAPSEAIRSNNGMLTFGGMDESVVSGKVVTVERTETSPSRSYWGVDMSFSLGDNEFGARTAGITDTGTTLVLVADDYFESYAEMLSEFGGEIDQSTGLIRIPSDAVNQVPDLNFKTDAAVMPLIGDAQFFPESLNSQLGISNGGGFRYSVTSSMGTTSGSGMDFIWGMKALERYTTGYDSDTGATHFAATMFTKVEFRELAQAVAMFNNSTAVAADREPIIEESSVTIEADEGSSSGAAAAVVFKGVSNREYFSLLLPLFLSSLLWVL